jgi:hypothetical protein
MSSMGGLAAQRLLAARDAFGGQAAGMRGSGHRTRIAARLVGADGAIAARWCRRQGRPGRQGLIWMVPPFMRSNGAGEVPNGTLLATVPSARVTRNSCGVSASAAAP